MRFCLSSWEWITSKEDLGALCLVLCFSRNTRHKVVRTKYKEPSTKLKHQALAIAKSGDRFGRDQDRPSLPLPTGPIGVIDPVDNHLPVFRFSCFHVGLDHLHRIRRAQQLELLALVGLCFHVADVLAELVVRSLGCRLVFPHNRFDYVCADVLYLELQEVLIGVPVRRLFGRFTSRHHLRTSLVHVSSVLDVLRFVSWRRRFDRDRLVHWGAWIERAVDQVIVQTNLVPVKFNDDEVRLFAFHDRLLPLLKNRRQSKQNGKEEYFHLGTDYTRSGQQGKVISITRPPSWAL